MDKEFTLESFINWCDDMYIVNEGFDGSKIKEGFAKAINGIIETFTKIAEWFRRAILNVQNKMNGHKYIKIPKVYHKQIQDFRRDVINFWNYDARKMSDENLKAIKDDWASLKKEIIDDKKHLIKDGDEYTSQSAIQAKEFYEDMITDSKNISGGLKYAKDLRSKLSTMKDEQEIENMKIYIHKVKNEIELSRMLIDMSKFYLSFEFVSEDKVNPVENPKSQVVTQQERDEFKAKTK